MRERAPLRFAIERLTAARKLALSWAIVLICYIWSIIMNFDGIDLDLIEIVEDLFSNSYVIIYQGGSYEG